MSQSKKYQKIMGLAMGAVLLGTPVVQSSTPVFAEDTADTQATIDTQHAQVDLNQLIQAAQTKVNNTVDTSGYLATDLPSRAALKIAIVGAQDATIGDLQTRYTALMKASTVFDADYQKDLANYHSMVKSIEAYHQATAGNLTDIGQDLKDQVDPMIAEFNTPGKKVFRDSADFEEEIQNIFVNNVDPVTPVLQTDSKLQDVLNVGQKVVDSGQYTPTQLKDLQQAMAGIPTEVVVNYQDLAQTSIDAINAALAALPKSSTPGQATPIASSQAIMALQQFLAEVEPNVFANSAPQLQTALTAAKIAIANKGVGYSDQDLAVLQYALSKAYDRYGNTKVTSLNGVGQVFTKGQGVVLYNQPAGQKILITTGTVRTLTDQSAWKVFSAIQLPDGSTWYNVGKNQWIDANYVLLEKGQVVKITVQNGAKLWQLNQEIFSDTNRTLGYQTDWRSFGNMLVDDQTYYNLGGNQWVNAQDVTVDK